MQTWTGKLYIFEGADGQQYVTVVSPASSGIDPLKIHAYRVTGPFIPVGWPKAVAVRDASQWLAELQKQDFACEPCSVD